MPRVGQKKSAKTRVSPVAKTVTEFIHLVETIRDPWDQEHRDPIGLWFRGIRKSNWPLLPKLYRHLDFDAAVGEAEDDIREDFIRRAPSLSSYQPSNAWEWYFLMQHYGAPTRLLDWTENGLMGLYFAVKDSESLQDAAVWLIDPWWLNQQVTGKTEVLPPGSAGLAQADTKRYRPWLPDRFDPKKHLRKKLPIAVFPNYFDRRIAAQRSCFTIHGVLRDPLETIFPSADDHLAKITIPAYTTESIKEELDEFGIDEVAIYPDLQGLGVSVSNAFIEKRTFLPHEGICTRLGQSQIHGVGVFAIKKIKKGTELFPEDSDEMRWIDAALLPKHKHLRQFYDAFAVEKDGKYGCPQHFSRLTMSWYLNDPAPGTTPNVRCDDNFEFWALRDIQKNEELTVDSDTYSEHNKKKDPRLAKASKTANARSWPLAADRILCSSPTVAVLVLKP